MDWLAADTPGIPGQHIPGLDELMGQPWFWPAMAAIGLAIVLSRLWKHPKVLIAVIAGIAVTLWVLSQID